MVVYVSSTLLKLAWEASLDVAVRTEDEDEDDFVTDEDGDEDEEDGGEEEEDGDEEEDEHDENV
ncbi:hypothetical protein Drorol1_Dr00005600 [Drosera rotundifolia]